MVANADVCVSPLIRKAFHMFTLKNSKIQSWIILGLAWLGTFLASYSQNQLAGMAIQYQGEYGFTALQYADIYSSYQFLAIFVAFAAGLLSDKIGSRRAILIAGVITAVALTARIFLTSFDGQFWTGMFASMTATFITVNLGKLFGGWFRTSMLALVFGLYTTTTPIANTLGIGVTSLMPSIEFAFGTSAVLSIVFVVVWFLFGQDYSADIVGSDVKQGEQNSGVVKNLKALLKDPKLWLLSLAFVFVMAGQVPLMAFSTSVLQVLRGMDAVAAGGMLTAFTIGMGVGSVVSPFILKAVKAYRPIVAVYCIIAALMAVFAWQLPIGPVMYAAYFVGGICLGYILTILFNYPILLFGYEKAGTAQGITQTFALIGAAVFLTNVTIPLAGGASPETFPTIMLIAGVFIVIGSALLFVLPDQGKKAIGAEAEK